MEDEFGLLGAIATCGQGEAKASLVLAEGAFDGVTLVVDCGWEVSPQRMSVGRPGWALACVAGVERDHALAHADVADLVHAVQQVDHVEAELRAVANA